jgi:hypothetical protein
MKWPPAWESVVSQLRVEFRTGCCEGRTCSCEADEFPLLETVTRKG